MHSKNGVNEDVVVLKTNRDTQETTSQPVLQKTGPNTKTTCPKILAKNEPYFKIMTTGVAVSTVLIHHSNKVGCVFPVVISGPNKAVKTLHREEPTTIRKTHSAL